MFWDGHNVLLKLIFFVKFRILNARQKRTYFYSLRSVLYFSFLSLSPLSTLVEEAGEKKSHVHKKAWSIVDIVGVVCK